MNLSAFFLLIADRWARQMPSAVCITLTFVKPSAYISYYKDLLRFVKLDARTNIANFSSHLCFRNVESPIISRTMENEMPADCRRVCGDCGRHLPLSCYGAGTGHGIAVGAGQLGLAAAQARFWTYLRQPTVRVNRRSVFATCPPRGAPNALTRSLWVLRSGTRSPAFPASKILCADVPR